MNVSDMKVGQVGYVVPWAVGKSGNDVFVNTEADVDQEPGGTVTVKIKRYKNHVGVDGSAAGKHWLEKRTFPSYERLPGVLETIS